MVKIMSFVGFLCHNGNMAQKAEPHSHILHHIHPRTCGQNNVAKIFKKINLLKRTIMAACFCSLFFMIPF